MYDPVRLESWACEFLNTQLTHKNKHETCIVQLD